jgi:tetratricopeptide (TPR) repeat protein
MSDNRRIRVFVSSTFRDMAEERNELMTHAWPALRRLCRERQVELVEVDLRWGIAEEQSTRRETLKLCLDEIRSCRPFFIGVLGERYGWVPGDDAFTADLAEEQPWLRDLTGRSVTELEILHGVLNNPEMAGRSFFYFRDPAYAEARGADFLSEDEDAARKQLALKALIRKTCAEKRIPFHENYPDPQKLASLVADDLRAVIEAQFPVEDTPDLLTREARDHEAFAESRRRTYIGRPEYFSRLDRHAAGDGGPLVLLGDSGGGKSALLANWIEHWRRAHPHDFVLEHYIGGTPGSADHWQLIARIIAEIKQWTKDSGNVPHSHDDLLRDFPLWLNKARAHAEFEGVGCIIVLDALNQLEDRDHARLLGWLSPDSFTGPLRLVLSTLPVKSPADDPQEAVDDPLKAITERGWETLRIEPLTHIERSQMIVHYLARFGKTLDVARLDRLAAAPVAGNPLYLKILLDELRVTGTHDRLDERLSDYLRAADIPALLGQVLDRYRRDYERDRPGLVSEALGLIWAARRGLSETEILRLLKPADLPQLPPAAWSPFRAAVEDSLVDRGGILNFAHDFLRSAVEAAFVPNNNRRAQLRLQLADYFEQLPVSGRTCDELPWLLAQAGSPQRLRACLLDMDRFMEIHFRDNDELRQYWVDLREEHTMGAPYLAAYEEWSRQPALEEKLASHAACELALFLRGAALYAEAEPLYRRALAIDENSLGPTHPHVAIVLSDLGWLLQSTNRAAEAEPLYHRALTIEEKNHGFAHSNVASCLNNLAQLLRETNRLAEAEPLYRRALAITEQSYGPEHHNVAVCLTTLAQLLKDTNCLAEAEPLYRRALAIDERIYGPGHPEVATDLNDLALVLQATNRRVEAEPLMRRALAIDEKSYGPEHPHTATALNSLAQLLKDTNRMAEAEPLCRRALDITEQSYGPEHPIVARSLSRLAQLLHDTGRDVEAEPLMRRAVVISEKSYGPSHPGVATGLNDLAGLLCSTNRLAEAEPLYRRALAIDERSYGPQHPKVATSLNNLAELLQTANRLAEAEPLYRRMVAIFEANDPEHQPHYAGALNNLAGLFKETNRRAEAEPLYRRALVIDEESFGPQHPEVATRLNNLAQLLQETNRLAEAEPLMRRALAIDEQSYGSQHPHVARDLNNLAHLLNATGRLEEAEPLYRRALAIDEVSFGPLHPEVAIRLNNLAQLLQETNRLAEAEPLMRRALAIDEQSYGPQHPMVAGRLNNLAGLLDYTKRPSEAEPLYRRALVIYEQSYGPEHPNVAVALNNIAGLLYDANRLAEAEPLMRRALKIDELSLGPQHPMVANRLNNLAQLLQMTNRLLEAEPLRRRALEILLNFTRSTGHEHPSLGSALRNYAGLLEKLGLPGPQIWARLSELAPEFV